MTCSRALISAYHDGTLSLAERRQVETHLRQCLSCRAALQDYQAIRRSMGGLPQYGAPPATSGELHAQIAAQGLRPVSRPHWNPLIASAASVAVLMAAALAGGPLVQHPAEPSPLRPVVAFALPQDQATGVSLESVIEIRFNTPVDRDSVQQSLNVSPPVPARVEWQQDKVLIVPEQRLDPDTTYTISMGAAPQRQEPVQFSLRTGQAPTLPADANSNAGALVHAVTRTPTASVAQAAAAAATPAAQPPSVFRTAGAAIVGPVLPGGAPCAVPAGPRLSRFPELSERVGSLGCAREAEWPSVITVQTFEGGVTLWSPELRSVYLLHHKTGTWDVHPAAPSSADRPGAPGSRPPLVRTTPTAVAIRPAAAAVAVTPTRAPGNASSPVVPANSLEGWRRITMLWLQDAAVREVLGMPTDKDHTNSGTVQEFDRGVVVGVQGATYLLTDDHAWRVLQDSPQPAARPQPPMIAP